MTYLLERPVISPTQVTRSTGGPTASLLRRFDPELRDRSTGGDRKRGFTGVGLLLRESAAVLGAGWVRNYAE